MTVDVPTIGWREWVSLPQFSLAMITAKVDTGALTSSLHAGELLVVDDGPTPLARFEFHPDRDSEGEVTVVTAPVIDFREITSSNGQTETRPVVRTELVLANGRHEIDLTLTSRASMGHRLLLGRRFLADRFVVDPARTFLLAGSEVTS